MHISKEFAFEASHILPRHQGKCSRLHGHSWKLRITVFGDVEKETGFVMDYAELSKLVQPIVDRFDHQHLNAFVRYPSSENIATHIAYILNAWIPFNQLMVEVSETAKTWACWDGRDESCRAILCGELDMMAEWRSPEFSSTYKDTTDSKLQSLKTSIFEVWTELHAELIQRGLYRESMGRPGAIQEELKEAAANEEKQG